RYCHDHGSGCACGGLCPPARPLQSVGHVLAGISAGGVRSIGRGSADRVRSTARLPAGGGWGRRRDRASGDCLWRKPCLGSASLQPRASSGRSGAGYRRRHSAAGAHSTAGGGGGRYRPHSLRRHPGGQSDDRRPHAAGRHPCLCGQWRDPRAGIIAFPVSPAVSRRPARGACSPVPVCTHRLKGIPMTVLARRTFILASAGALLAAPPVLRPAEARTTALTIASLLGEDKPETLVWRWIAERMEERLPGRFRFNVVANAALGGEKEVAEGARLGSIQASLSTVSTLSAWVPELQLLDLPFLFRDAGHLGRVVGGATGADLTRR